MYRKPIFLVGYVVLLVALLELVTRLFLNPESLCRPFLCQDEASWRLWWVSRHRTGEEIMYSFDVHDPQRGWALRPNVNQMKVFSDKVLSSNSQGFRGAKEYDLDKPAGTTRIIALGDSFTFGEEVSDDETFASRLGQSLPTTEVMNLGVHGYGHDQMLLYLREVGARYHPDVVLLGFVQEDMNRNLLGFRDFAKPHFVLDASEQLVLEGTPVPSPEAVLARERWRPELLELLTVLHQAWRWKSGANERESEKLASAILGDMVQEIGSLGGKSVFVYLPVGADLGASGPAPGEVFLSTFCRERGISCLSLRPVLAKAAQSGAPLETRWHWSPLAHSIAAREIRRFLVGHGLVSADGSSATQPRTADPSSHA
jgi:hypothetical protein